MKELTVIIEAAPNNYGAYIQGVDGIVLTLNPFWSFILNTLQKQVWNVLPEWTKSSFGITLTEIRNPGRSRGKESRAPSINWEET